MHREFINPVEVDEMMQICRRLLFNRYFDVRSDDRRRMEQMLGGLVSVSCLYAGADISASDVSREFFDRFDELREVLATDVEATYLGDPAATSPDEVVLCYPGIHAIFHHRVAHLLVSLGVPLLPRIISELAHSRTGIDIHPGASIGGAFTIDHGTGVVVGATTIIGDRVKIYQGVTLGARSFTLDDNGNPVKGIARHPVVGDDVIIYSNTTVLGRVRIGDGAVIGGNLWITFDVGAGEKIVQARPDNFLRINK